MRTTCTTIAIATLLGLSACSDLHCLDTERKVGSVCYPKVRAVDAAATADDGDSGAAEAGPRPDAGDASIEPGPDAPVDSSTVEFTDASTSVPTEPQTAPQDASGDAQPGEDADSGASVVAPETPVEAEIPVDAGPGAPDAAPIAPPPKPCPNGEPNVCGGCEPQMHSKGEACSNGGTGPCARAGSYQCSGKVLLCDAPPPAPSPEVCDDVDNDCDGTKDDGLSGCCPPGATRATDPDCKAVCGNGVLEQPEEACEGPDTWHCSPTCQTRKIYVPCDPGLPNPCGAMNTRPGGAPEVSCDQGVCAPMTSSYDLSMCPPVAGNYKQGIYYELFCAISCDGPEDCPPFLPKCWENPFASANPKEVAKYCTLSH